MSRDYKILGLNPGVPFDDVKRAYKKLVSQWHPDRFPADDADLQKKAHDKFQDILEAFKRIEEAFNPADQERFANDQSHSEFRWSSYHEGEDASGPDAPHESQEESEQAPGFYTRTWPSGDSYEGQMHNDMMHGMGIYTFSNGDRYTGQFRFNKPDGQGKMVYANGDLYTGEFRQDRMHGRGTYNYANGDRFVGQFQDDLPHGEGAHILASGQVHAGLWEKGYLLS